MQTSPKYYTFLLLLVFIFAPKIGHAADFNPNNIISDSDLWDYESMGRADIRSFLRNRNSGLTDMITSDVEGKNRYASEIIYQAARNYQVNPKYLLVKLQKEQSLVTTPAPTERQLNWAAGYGACDGCDTTDPNLEKYKGFGKQVDSAAGIMRWYYDHINSEGWIKKPNITYTIDNTEVTPANQATAFLYTYTPHLHGNANFGKLWTTWFSQVYPDGTLIKSQASSTVFAIIAGEKRPIKSMSVLSSRFNAKLLVTIAPEDLARYKTGATINYTNYSLLKVTSTYYLLDNEIARPFASPEIFHQFGYNPDEVIDASDEDLASYTIGDSITLEDLYPTGHLVTVGGTIYYLKNAKYYFIPSPEISKVRFPRSKPQLISPNELAKFEPGGPLLFPDATLVGSQLTKNVYVIEKDKKRLIPSEKVFLELGYKWSTIIWVDDLTLDQHTNGEPIYAGSISDDTTTSTPKLELTAAKKLPPKKSIIKKPVPKKVILKKVIKPIKKTVAIKKPTPVFFVPPTSTEPMPFPETSTMYTLKPEFTTFSEPHITTPIDSYVIARLDNGVPEIVATKNPDVPRPLASLTKVMTGYRLFNDNLDLESEVRYDPPRHHVVYDTYYKLAAGDTVKNKDLLDALLVSSFNTPAYMLIDSLGKTKTDFVNEMNDQARNFNLERTFFYDPSGYDVRNQSTAREYLHIFSTATTNESLRDYMDTPNYEYEEVVSVNKVSLHRDVNSNHLFQITNKPYTILASKTGYLNEAGYNVAMLISRDNDGQEFLIITLGNPDYSKKYSEADRVTRWALNTF